MHANRKCVCSDVVRKICVKSCQGVCGRDMCEVMSEVHSSRQQQDEVRRGGGRDRITVRLYGSP